jgi:hypothetical protein
MFIYISIYLDIHSSGAARRAGGGGDEAHDISWSQVKIDELLHSVVLLPFTGSLALDRCLAAVETLPSSWAVLSLVRLQH